jgi:glycine/D-amino acid oxidase-like deaminating enzyme
MESTRKKSEIGNGLFNSRHLRAWWILPAWGENQCASVNHRWGEGGFMKLYSGSLYWDKTVDAPDRFEKVKEGKRTQVLIAGGGISGTLCAYVLSAMGMDVILAEKNKIGKGSSIASTGLLQYRSDKMLCEFADAIGEERGHLFYRMCLEAMDQLTLLSKSLGDKTEYRSMDSLYFASEAKDVKKLVREYELLRKYDFPVEFLDEDRLRRIYQIHKPCALRTWHDADVNPYRWIQALTRKNIEQGVRYFENTELDLDNIQGNGILTKEGHSIQFEHLILTTGYSKIYPMIKDKIMIRRTYAFCSKPMKDDLWKDHVMVWETKNPYLYFRTTMDDRIIGGGLDEDQEDLEQDGEKIMAKAKRIAAQIETIFPNLDIQIDAAWNALFCGSKDGLPFIGADPVQENRYYLLGYEGNGMCYSMAGALILKDHILGKPNRYQDIVRMDRGR